MEMLRFPGTSSSVCVPKIVALMGLSPFGLPTLQRERLHLPSGELPQAVLWPPGLPQGAGRGAAAGCRLKSSCISFMSNQLAENWGRGGHDHDDDTHANPTGLPLSLVSKKL